VVKKFIADLKINYQIVMGDDRIARGLRRHRGDSPRPSSFDRTGTVAYQQGRRDGARGFAAVLKPFLK